MFCVYILKSQSKDIHYVGHAEDVDSRVDRHNAGRNNFTKRGVPWVLVYTEVYHARSEAMKREHKIKSKKSQSYLEKLVAKNLGERGA